VIQNSDMTEQ